VPITVTMLGTSSMVPTKTRSAPAVLIDYAGDYILVDCGEGAQRQMSFAGKSRARVRRILITHWHGDHVGGLAPLMQTMLASHFTGVLDIFGPVGTENKLRCLAAAVDLTLEHVVVRELAPPRRELVTFYDTPDYRLACAQMQHGPATVGYVLIEPERRRIDLDKARALGLGPGPLLGEIQRGAIIDHGGTRIGPDDICYMQRGKRVAVVPDTLPCDEIALLAAGADLMICESTYAGSDAELAEAYQHLTATHTAEAARRAGAKRLVLTHFSQRYEDVSPLVAEAAAVFPNVIAAHDLMTITV
jgi:ribonuclease Z